MNNARPQQVGEWNGICLPTFYGGTTLRSRLEARWAVFFDTLGIQWQYEAEGYQTPHGNYLPDFYLPELNYLFEIKPPTYKDLDGATFNKLAWSARETGCEGFLVIGAPCQQVSDSGPISDSAIWTGGDHRYVWCECPGCGRLEMQFDGRADRISCPCPARGSNGDKGYNFDSPRILQAIATSVGWRFR